MDIAPAESESKTWANLLLIFLFKCSIAEPEWLPMCSVIEGCDKANPAVSLRYSFQVQCNWLKLFETARSVKLRN